MRKNINFLQSESFNCSRIFHQTIVDKMKNIAGGILLAKIISGIDRFIRKSSAKKCDQKPPKRNPAINCLALNVEINPLVSNSGTKTALN